MESRAFNEYADLVKSAASGGPLADFQEATALQASALQEAHSAAETALGILQDKARPAQRKFDTALENARKLADQTVPGSLQAVRMGVENFGELVKTELEGNEGTAKWRFETKHTGLKPAGALEEGGSWEEGGGVGSESQI